MGKTVAKIIAYVLAALVLVTVVGLIYKFTNGFNEDFKTFYVEYDGKQILTAGSKLDLEMNSAHTFKVKYTFDKEDAEPKDYNVKIVPHVTKDFDYTVDGERYIFSKVTDLTPAFGLKKEQTSFTLTIPDKLDIQKALSIVHIDKAVSVPEQAEENNPRPFRLVVSSYNDKVVYNIDLEVREITVSDIELDKPNIVFPINPDTPNDNGNQETPTTPTTPTINEHSIEYLSTGDATDLSGIRVTGEKRAVKDTTVHFKVEYNADEYEITGMRVTVWNSNETVTIEQDADGYYFTMPNYNITIWITFELVEQGEFYLIEYDTLGWGGANVTCPAKAREGETVTLIASASEPENRISHVVMQDWDGEEIADYELTDGKLTFTMPAHNVSFMFYIVPLDM